MDDFWSNIVKHVKLMARFEISLWTVLLFLMARSSKLGSSEQYSEENIIY